MSSGLRARRLLALALALCAADGEAAAFPHVVKRGETLADIAQRTYGKVEVEAVLVVANGLDAHGGATIQPGMRLELPAVEHHVVRSGEGWTGLAERFLGRAERADVLAFANGGNTWIPPEEGRELAIPYNLRYVVAPGDSTLGVAYRFLGAREKAWMLDHYNGLRGRNVREGDVLLVPISDLVLTPEGKREAREAAERLASGAAGEERAAQARALAELPALRKDVEDGRWASAIARGSRMLGGPSLSRSQVADVQRWLTEAFVAEGELELATAACAEWLRADPRAELDPIELSPKVVRACTAALGRAPPRARGRAEPAASASASAPASASARAPAPPPRAREEQP